MSNRTAEFFKNPKARLILKFGFIYLVFFALSWHRLDPDFGWHLKAGDYYRQYGIPSHDIFTFTARNFDWINHEWGNDLLLSLFYAIGGYGLLSFLYAGLWTAAFMIRALKVRFIFLLAAMGAVLPYAGIRPVAWTFLLFALLLRLLENQKKPPYLLIASLFAAWANLHAGFVIGLALILYYFVRTRHKYYAKLLSLGILATFINPYGPRLYVEVGRTLFDVRLHNQISEWNNFVVFTGSLTFIGLWWAGFLLYKRKKLSNWLGLGPLLFAAALSASRNLPLFVITTINDLEKYYQNFRAEAPKNLNYKARAVLLISWVGLISFLIYGSYGQLLPWTNREDKFPKQAVSYLKANPCPGRIFNDYNYGGYLIWKLPSQPVYIDGRMSSWRAPDGQKYLDKFLKIPDDQNLRQKEFSHYGIKCVLIRSSNTKLIDSLQNDGWQTRLKANSATLLEKS